MGKKTDGTLWNNERGKENWAALQARLVQTAKLVVCSDSHVREFVARHFIAQREFFSRLSITDSLTYDLRHV